MCLGQCEQKEAILRKVTLAQIDKVASTVAVESTRVMGQLVVLYSHLHGTSDSPQIRKYRGIGPHGSNAGCGVWSLETSIGKFSQASGESRRSFSVAPDFDSVAPDFD